MSTLCLIDIRHLAGDELSNSQVFDDQIHMSDVAVINNQATSRGATVLRNCTSARLPGDGCPLSERGGPATSSERMFERNLRTLIHALSPYS